MLKKRSLNTRNRQGNRETDSTYFLKLVVVIIFGSFWLRLHQPFVYGDLVVTALPVGCIVGLFLVSRYERIQNDRKIWYALLIITTMLSYLLPTGVVI